MTAALLPQYVRAGRPGRPVETSPPPLSLPGFLAVAVGLCLAYLVALVVGGETPWAERLTDASFVVFPALATYGLYTGIARHATEQRTTWALLSLSTATWTCGGLVWCWYSFTRGQVPFPSPVDVLLIGYVAPAVLGLLLLSSQRGQRLPTLRVALDTVVMALSLLLIVWSVALGPVLAGSSGLTAVERAFALAYPAGDLVLLAVVAATVIRVRTSDVGAWTALLGGLSLLAVTDVMYATLVASASYDRGAVYNVAWAFCFTLIAAAPHVGPLTVTHGARPNKLQALLPYALLAAAAATVVPLRVDLSDDPLLFTGGLLLLLTASARELLVVVDEVRLAGHLEERVAQVTSRLQEERAFLHAVVDQLRVAVVACDEDGVLSFHNRAAADLHADPEGRRLGGWARDLYTATGEGPLPESHDPLRRALSGQEVSDQRITVVAPAREPAVMAASGRVLRDEAGKVRGAVVVMHEMTQESEQSRGLHLRARHDDLTGLGNREHFEASLTVLLRDVAQVAVLLLDLDDFKHVNDSLGHAAGDQCLVQVARRLQESLPSGAVVCRLGGDEFVLLLPGLDRSAVLEAASAVLARLSRVLTVAGTELKPTASLGVAYSGPGCSTSGELLKAADLAMYVAKDRGKGQYAVYEERLRQVAIDRTALESDLRQALQADALHVVYQPIVDLTSGALNAVEALVRWDHPERGPVSPVDFIPVAESTGLILPLGSWVLRHACAQLLAWDADGGHRDLRLTVNVSTRQLERPGLLEVLDECLRSGVEPDRLCLEITETALAYDGSSVQQTLHAVRERGVHLAVDDFGTGYSSLSRLRSAPVSRLKIDRAFISEISSRDADVPIVDATMSMARGLGLAVVAEGIETSDQLVYLRDTGCPEGQGYLLSRPVGPDAIGQLLRGPVPWAHLLEQQGGVRTVRGGVDLDELLPLAVDGNLDLAEFCAFLLPALTAATGATASQLTCDTAQGPTVVATHPSRPAGSVGLGHGLSGQVPVGSVSRSAQETVDVLTEPVRTLDGQVFGALRIDIVPSRGSSVNEGATLRMFGRLVEQKLHTGSPRPAHARVEGARVPPPGPSELRDRRVRAGQRWEEFRAQQDGRAGRTGGASGLLDLEAAERARLGQLLDQRMRGDLAPEETTVVIADDVRLLRQVLAAQIEGVERLLLVGQAEDAASTLGIVVTEQPDILVLDYELGDATAADIIGPLRRLSPRTRILLHSGRDDIGALGQRLNVDRSVHKGEGPAELTDALRDLVP